MIRFKVKRYSIIGFGFVLGLVYLGLVIRLELGLIFRVMALCLIRVRISIVRSSWFMDGLD